MGERGGFVLEKEKKLFLALRGVDGDDGSLLEMSRIAIL